MSTAFSVLPITVSSVSIPPTRYFHHSCFKPVSLHPSLCPLYLKTMCGMSFQLPPRWRRAPNKTKQLSLSSLGPGLHPLSLSNSPLSPTGLRLRSLPSVAVSVSWAEGLLSASLVERLADFSLHVSFKGLSRSRHTRWPWHKEEGEVLRRGRRREGRSAKAEQRMMACSGSMWLVLMWWRGRGMDGLAVGWRTGFTVPALNYFNWSH